MCCGSKHYYPGTAGVTTKMLVRLLIVSVLVAASMGSKAPKSCALLALDDTIVSVGNLGPAGLDLEGPKLEAIMIVPAEMWTAILLKLGFADLYQTSYVSKNLREWADHVVKKCYINRNNKTGCLNYSAVLRELDVLVRDSIRDNDIVKANGALRSSPHFGCIKSVLEAEFGYCIRYCKEHLPRFDAGEVHVHIVNDAQKISAVPYIIDNMLKDPRLLYFIQGLVELDRPDLFNQMTFSKIDSRRFHTLMSVLLPEPARIAAVKSMLENKPKSKLSQLFACLEPGTQICPLAQDCMLPLFVLPYMHAHKIAVPEKGTLIGGLDEAALSFWTHVLGSSKEHATELLNLVLQYGDAESRRMAGALYEPTSADGLENSEQDVYQAVLIRFRFSHHNNSHVTQNYDGILGRLLVNGYRTVCALLDCGQFELIEQHFHELAGDSVAWEAIADEVYRRNLHNRNALISKCVGNMVCPSLKFLQRLIRQKVDNSYVEIVWNAIGILDHPGLADGLSGSAALAMGKNLALGLYVPLDVAEVILSMQPEFEGKIVASTEEERLLYAAMDWQASEAIIIHFLDQVPGSCSLEPMAAVRLLRLTRYSLQFWKTIIGRCREIGHLLRAELIAFRPDLVEKLGLAI